MKREDRLRQVAKMINRYTPNEIAETLGVHRATIYRDIKSLGEQNLSPPSAEEKVADAKARAKRLHERRSDRDLVNRIIELEKELDVAVQLTNARSFYRIPHTPSPKTEAVAVMVASDWHIEEIVKSWQVNGLNEFNEAICRTRIRRFFEHGVKLLKKEQADTKIDTLILALLGDFISGSIHDELMEGNRLLPTDAIIEIQEHLYSGIKFILDNTDVNLVIPCKSGNHGRFTKKNRVSTEAGNSLERIMYHSLQVAFKDEPRVKFLVSKGYHAYIEVWDNFTIRFHHGHSIRYYGGVGGISIPMNKAVAQWNKAQRADLDVCGHFHQFLDGGRWVVNGSLIGYSAYALSIKASPGDPEQAFFLVDKSVGKTLVCPIILTEDR